MRHENQRPYLFPKWTNLLRPAIAVGVLIVPLYLAGIVTFGFSPKATDVGYMPTQPVPYSHALHAGELGIDCRYCHTSVETGANANIPPTQTCMNCHAAIRTESPNLIPIKESHATGMPVEWIRVHDLPDYVYFNHSAHVQRGVGCVECHGRVDKMEVVYQQETLSMGWCLDCHRAPESHLRPAELATDMNWQPNEDPEVFGRKLREERNINPSTDCSTCHR